MVLVEVIIVCVCLGGFVANLCFELRGWVA